jgi:putative pyrroloquinoline-quinone-binding quinoprotein
MNGDGGNLLWEYDCGATLVGAPWVDGENVIVRTDKGVLLALDVMPGMLGAAAVPGRLRWVLRGCERVLARGRNTLFVLAATQEILAVNEKTGEVTARHPRGRFSQFVTNPLDDLLYALQPGGTVVSFTDRD